MTDYNIIVFDAQYILARNYYALKSRNRSESLEFITETKDPNGYLINKFDFDYQDLVKQFFWSIVKLIRDDYSCDKVILLWDKAPYYKLDSLPHYKAGREYHPITQLDEYDIEADPQGYLQEKENCRIELVKQEAKYWIINNLDSFGLPSLIYDGYEADDLAYLLCNKIDLNLKCAICSNDSDWMYWISDKVDYINFTSKESWTYDDVSLDNSRLDKEFNIDLFELKSYIDSIFGSHNGLINVSKLNRSGTSTVIREVRSSNYENITDQAILMDQLKSFDIVNYPEYDFVIDKLRSLVNTKYSYPTMDKYDELLKKGFKVSRSYVANYMTLLNKDWYE